MPKLQFFFIAQVFSKKRFIVDFDVDFQVPQHKSYLITEFSRSFFDMYRTNNIKGYNPS